MGLLSNKINRDELKPGDHIYSWRSLYVYAHHGIYVDDGNVIHFTSGAGQENGTGTRLDHFISSSVPSNPYAFLCPNCGDQSGSNGVISSCLDCFLSGNDLYRFEYGVTTAFFLAKRGGTCTLAVSDPTNEVLHRAEYLLNNGFGDYDLLTNNCEDFANYCKTGTRGRSGQASSFKAGVRSALTMGIRYMSSGVGATEVISAGVRYCISRINTDIGMSGASTMPRLTGRNAEKAKRKGKGVASSSTPVVPDEFTNELRAMRITREKELEVKQEIEQKRRNANLLNVLLAKPNLTPQEEQIKNRLLEEYL